MSPEQVLTLLGDAPLWAQLTGLILSIVLPYLAKKYLPGLLGSGTTPRPTNTEEGEEEVTEDRDVRDLRTTLRSVLSALQRAQEEIEDLSTNLDQVTSEKEWQSRELEKERAKSRDLAQRVAALTDEVRRAQGLLESLAAGRATNQTPPPTPPDFWAP